VTLEETCGRACAFLARRQAAAEAGFAGRESVAGEGRACAFLGRRSRCTAGGHSTGVRARKAGCRERRQAAAEAGFAGRESVAGEGRA
jgi:hypothetical protein